MNKFKSGVSLLLALTLISMTLSFIGCSSKDKYKSISGLNKDEKATVKIAIPQETNKALNNISNEFMKLYPNVNIQIQYVEDYDKNAVQMFKENKLDIILQKDIVYSEEKIVDDDTGEETLTGKTTDDYFYNFAADNEIDFSDTTSDITDNYNHIRIGDDGEEISYTYCYALGGETRGVFVNKTFLNEYGLSVPTNFTEFLSCCESLKKEGYVPIQGGGDTAAYGLGLAPAANAITHNETALSEMKAANPGVSEYFKDTLEKLYTLATNRYFDYKAVEQTGFYTKTNELGQVQSFLGLTADETTLEITKPENGYGNVAFMPYLSSTSTLIQSLIDEYDLTTEFEFICSPLNDEGEKSSVYVTPYYGICLNKNSENLMWLREFVNFVFHEQNNKTYASDAEIIPNTKDAMQYISDTYNVDIEKNVTLCGQIRFSSDYNGYTPIADALKSTLKCSAQKYMINLNKDDNGNIGYLKDDNGKEYLMLGNDETMVYKEYVGDEDEAMPGYAFCTLDYYVNILEENFSKYRVG